MQKSQTNLQRLELFCFRSRKIRTFNHQKLNISNGLYPETRKDQTLEDLVPLLGNRSPEEDGVGVVGRRSEPIPVGESREEEETASEYLDATATFEDGEGESSTV